MMTWRRSLRRGSPLIQPPNPLVPFGGARLLRHLSGGRLSAAQHVSDTPVPALLLQVPLTLCAAQLHFRRFCQVRASLSIGGGALSP